MTHYDSHSSEISWTYLDYLHKEVFVADKDVALIAQSGPNDDAVAEVLEDGYFQHQFEGLSTDDIISATKKLMCDCDDTENIQTREDAIACLLWISAWNIEDDMLEMDAKA